MSDIFDMLMAVVQKDPSFLELEGGVPAISSRTSKLLKPGMKVKTLKNLQAGGFGLKRGSVGKILGVSKAPMAYVVAFDQSVVYVDPTLVAKASSTKEKTSVVFQAKSTRNFRVNASVRATENWGYMMTKLGAGEVGKVLSTSAGNFGSFDPMLVVRADSGHIYMVPEKYFEPMISKVAPQVSLSDEAYLSLDSHVDMDVAESYEVEAAEGLDFDLDESPQARTPDVPSEQSEMLEVIAKLEKMIDLEKFTAWLDSNKDRLSDGAVAFGEQLKHLWGNKLGVVFSYPVNESCVCKSSISTPYIYHSKLCTGCVSRSGNHCLKHSAGLLTEKQIANTSDFQFLRMISKSPIGFHRIFSSLEDYVKKELFSKVAVNGPSSIELDFDPDTI